MRRLLVQLVFLDFCLHTQLQTFLGQDCRLDDVQKTRGKCVPFRQCAFAINMYRANVKPKICDKIVVCCPIEETTSQKKCQEWVNLLKIPLNGLASDNDPVEPFCMSLESSGFIVGGRDARKYEFPHAAALGFRASNGEAEDKYICGGTLISDRYVLTAAHCAITRRGQPNIVLLGDLTLDRQTSSFRQIVEISEVIIHPDYKPPQRYNDIALVKLNQKLELSRFLLPACLPVGAYEKVNETLEAIGFGTLGPSEPQSNSLQAVNLTVYSTTDCNRYYSDSADKTFRYPQGIIRTQLCAGDVENFGRDTCNGDSGGPLTQNIALNGGTKQLRCFFRVLGITSFGAKLCGFGQPGVYTKVQSYVPWIEGVAFKD